MDKHEAISRLRAIFPEFNGENSSQQEGLARQPVNLGHEFARFVTHLLANPDSKKVQNAFDQVEDFLCYRNTELRK